MTINISWDDPAETLLVIDFQPKWSWDEYHQALNEAFSKVRSKSYTVHCVYLSNNLSLPAGNPIHHFSNSVRNQPKNLGLNILLDMPSFSKRLINTIAKIFPFMNNHIAIASNMDHARQIAANR